MTTKQWLMRARKLENRIIALQGSKRRAYDNAVSSTAHPREVCVISGGNSSPDDKTASYVIVGEEVDEQIDELNRIRAEILHAIRSVEDSILATLLIEYYVNGRTWDQVAVIISYSYQDTLQRKHPAALKEIRSVLEADKKCYTIA